jgi:enoyl-CoA hydratase/carnithine racemase
VTYEQIGYEVADGVLTVTLLNPQRRNALGQVMEGELRDALEAGDRDPAVQAIVLTGSGDSFCVGADMALLEQLGDEIPLPEPPAAVDLTDFDANYGRRFSYLLRIGTPMIAAINGAIAGVGLSIALYCDMRFMVRGAKLSTSFARRGLVAEHGTSWLLPRLIGPMNALDLLLTARKIDADEAAALGLVRSVPAESFVEVVRAYAEDLAANVSPRSTRIIKRQVYDALMQPLGEALGVAEQQEAASFTSADFAEGVSHFVERRPARFTGR